MPDHDTRDSQWFRNRLPRPEVLKAVLDDDPVDRLLTTARARAIVIGEDDLLAKNSAEEEQVAAMLHIAKEAARRLAHDPATSLTDEEIDALDLFTLLLARPAILVNKGRIREDPENWPAIKQESELLPGTIAGVGRIEFANHSKTGTGFLAGEKCILTNNHVVCGLIGLPRRDEWNKQRPLFDMAVAKYNEQWASNPDTRPWFDFIGELGSNDHTRRVRINRILGGHRTVDMAVLELDAVPQKAQRVKLATEEPKSFVNRPVYVIGYPIKDTGTPPAPLPILRRVFGRDESLGMKRFAPGLVMGWEGQHQFHHDASTLAGSSGSCIVDFDDHRVVGLHYAGHYGQLNRAVPLWKFRKDVLLTKNGVIFQEA